MTDTMAPIRIVTVREALREALFEEMEADERVILMGEDVS
jgi:pyruvate/2-oxoglutarate/acetoin dehydrogenase E1 component